MGAPRIDLWNRKLQGEMLLKIDTTISAIVRKLPTFNVEDILNT